jgi:diguanylate cyclase (GGDEF)-like protein
MDVNKASAITPVGAGASKQEPRRDPEGDKKENDPESGASPGQDTEAFAIDGILAGDLDPKVSQALESLARQIDPLRAEVELARGREDHFKDLAEKHSFLPLIGRREFFRELTHILSHAKDLGAPVLVVLHLVNGDDIRQRLGRSALDGALIHVAAVIDQSLHSTDVTGNLGGNDFGLVLLTADLESAGNVAQRLVDAITSQPFLWQSNAVTLQVVTGVAMLDGKTTPQIALDAADRDLLRACAAAERPAKADQEDEQGG